MIPHHKTRVSVTIDKALLAKLDDEARRWALHRSTVLSAAVNGGVQQGLLAMSKAGVKDLAEGRKVPMLGRGGFQPDLVDQPPSAAPSKPAPGKQRPDQYTIVQQQQAIEHKGAYIAALESEVQHLKAGLALAEAASRKAAKEPAYLTILQTCLLYTSPSPRDS